MQRPTKNSRDVARQLPLPLILAQCRKFLYCRKTSKIAKFGAKIPHFGESSGKIEILSTQNLLSQKFAAVCRKIATQYQR